MQYVGFVLLGLAVIGVIAALLQIAKGKKILAAPFRKTGEIASNPQAGDAKGLVSCEGDVKIATPLTSPCKSEPCVYYEYKLERQVEESTLTESGTTKSKKWVTVTEDKRGIAFQLDDGSGPVTVSAKDGIEGDLQKTHSGAPPGQGGAADVIAGALLGKSQYRATEHILPAGGRLFVMGRLADGQIVKTTGVLGKLTASTKGRDGMLASTKRTSMIAFAVGGVSLLGGVPLSIFGEPPKNDMCPDTIENATAASCKGKIDSDDGRTWTWAVKSPGEYTVIVKQPDVKYPIWAVLTLTDEQGKVVGTDTGIGKGADAKVTVPVGKGLYKLNVHDSVKGYAPMFAKGGGLSFWIDIQGPHATTAAATSVAATPPPAAGSATPASTPASPPASPAKAAATPASTPTSTAAKGGAAAPAKSAAPPAKGATKK
jgi:hypothetical protein